MEDRLTEKLAEIEPAEYIDPKELIFLKVTWNLMKQPKKTGLV